MDRQDQGMWDDTEIPVYSFESSIPPSILAEEGSAVSISGNHYKDGKHSLKWDFAAGSRLILRNHVGYRLAKDTFGIWIYCVTPIDDRLLFQFGRGGRTDVWFEFGLNFKGWRTAWVQFERDMTGKPHSDMDTLVITAPASGERGVIYFDQIVLRNAVDVRYPTRDAQVPFVHLEGDHRPSAHWLGLYRFHRMLPEPAGWMADGFEEQRKAVTEICAKYTNMIKKALPVSALNITDVRSEYKSYGIVRDSHGIRGRPVHLVHIKDIYPIEIAEQLDNLTHAVDVKDYTGFMLKVALYFHSQEYAEQRDELKRIFIDLVDHLHDQGWACGSSMGTVHHLGYNLRGYYPALFLMKEVLKEAGKLERVQKDMAWYSGLGRIYEPLEESYANIDILNTTLQGMLASVLMLDTAEEQHRHLFRLSVWLSHGLLPAPGLMPALKVDGSGYHHMGFYPAYAMGAYEGLAPVVYMLGGTPYRLASSSHESLKKAVLAVRLYSNKYEWLLSVSGRHPTGKERLTKTAFKYLALSGTPDASERIDPDLASAWLRLVEPGEDDETREWLVRQGFRAEPDPNGHWTMNYGSLSLHRRDHWLVGVRGHNRYIWSGELYKNANWYGRYTTYGQIQIMCGGNPVNNENSGYRHVGWDWNRWPGTTAIRLPLDRLKAGSFSEMLLTDETFSGGLNLLGENGMFAMKLHEHPKYNYTHRARKSVFMFDNRIISLGTDIENDDKEHPTETTLFQNALSSSEEPVWVNNLHPVTEFPAEGEITSDEPFWIVDQNGNGYYIAGGQSIGWHRKLQQSKDQRDGTDTQGQFASAWFSHGSAPKGGTYEYAVVVGVTAEEMRRFAQLMKNSQKAPYQVLQKDCMAHIVQDKQSYTTGYALFEENEAVDRGILAAVDTPSMVMAKQQGNRLVLSVVDPDLRFYEGIDEEQYDKDGRFVGKSPYDRPWQNRASRMHRLKLTLNGLWELMKQQEKCRIVEHRDGRTILEFDCVDSAPVEVQLDKLDE